MQIRAIALVTLLLVVQGWCKPSKNFEDLDYNEDVPADEDDDLPQGEDDGDSPDTIEEPPQITSVPKSIRVHAGSTVTLPCTTVNADSLAVVWKRGDEFLYSDENALTLDKDRIVRTPENSLVIYNTTVNDTSDTYTCSIMSDKPITITHRLLVDPIDRLHSMTTTAPVVPSSSSSASSPTPDGRVTPSDRVEAVQGQDVRLVCPASVQSSTEMKWYHQSDKLYNDQRTSIHGNTVTIHKVNRHDAGVYQCIADNGKNIPPHAGIHLVINYTPEIEVERETVHTGTGVESEITCIVHAHPRANVIWYKNQKELPKKAKISRKNYKSRHSLKIMHTSEEDFGDYTCVARNEYGQTSKTISLTGAPSQAMISGAEVTKDDNGFILKWHLQSYSPITQYKLKYRRKGDEEWQVMEPRVTDGKGIQYTVEHTIEGLQPGSYEAILVARNSFGWSPPSAPHTFISDHGTEEAAGVKTGSAVSIRPFWALPVSLLVVCAFRNL
ncbi:hypothetical protein KPH14_004905 [Odynerus spinipes]|uniref:Uncharacterized protein n=1 Tax=Odynerus spinipes TaxID=1348599 RepID=A0AAD9VQ52_9HYME|nr:hypothetical protein KPH14_004905 [Odynerus spinipes]